MKTKHHTALKTSKLLIGCFIVFVLYIAIVIYVYVNPFNSVTLRGSDEKNALSVLQQENYALLNFKSDASAKTEIIRTLEDQISALQSSLEQSGLSEKDAVSRLKDLENENSKLNVALHGIEEKDEEIRALQSKIEKLRSTPVSVHTTSVVSAEKEASRPGVIVLGMHRSGTSIVGGLMSKMGLNTGGPLIRPNVDNAKGFFERIDVVLQNDYIMRRQQVHYSANTYRYDALTGLKDILNDDGTLFKEGERSLKFLNNPSSYPWMLKDPRLCITLRTWLPLLNFLPAVLFTYRNPMDVALSMHTRETEHFPIARGMKLWYIYNKRAIQQSQDLCRVRTSHKLMMSQPDVETKRIVKELRLCGVPVPHEVSMNDVKSFVDTSLQHGKTSSIDNACADNADISTLMPPEVWPTTDVNHLHLFRSSVKAYCDMESGEAFKVNYKWDDSIKDN